VYCSHDSQTKGAVVFSPPLSGDACCEPEHCSSGRPLDKSNANRTANKTITHRIIAMANKRPFPTFQRRLFPVTAHGDADVCSVGQSSADGDAQSAAVAWRCRKLSLQTVRSYCRSTNASFRLVYGCRTGKASASSSPAAADGSKWDDLRRRRR